MIGASEIARNRDGRARHQSGHATSRRKRLHDEGRVERYWRHARLTHDLRGHERNQRRIISDRMLSNRWNETRAD